MANAAAASSSTQQGQSPWLDFIRRNMLNDGGLKRYVEQDGIRGVTANPTIFAQAIGAGDDYDAQIARARAAGRRAARHVRADRHRRTSGTPATSCGPCSTRPAAATAS